LAGNSKRFSYAPPVAAWIRARLIGYRDIKGNGAFPNGQPITGRRHAGIAEALGTLLIRD